MKVKKRHRFFKRGQYYYLVHGNLCCFCERGSDAKVLVSKDPMGPFVNVGNLNVFGSKTHVKVQSSDVFEVKEHSSGTVTYIWSGGPVVLLQKPFEGRGLPVLAPACVQVAENRSARRRRACPRETARQRILGLFRGRPGSWNQPGGKHVRCACWKPGRRGRGQAGVVVYKETHEDKNTTSRVTTPRILFSNLTSTLSNQNLKWFNIKLTHLLTV